MLDKFLVLLERFVVAHELIAANSAKHNVSEMPPEETPQKNAAVKKAAKKEAEPEEKQPEPKTAELPVEGEEVIDTPRKERKRAKPELSTEDMRGEIRTMAVHIGENGTDACYELFEEMLEKYNARTVASLKDDQVAEFYAECKLLVSKFWNVEED